MQDQRKIIKKFLTYAFEKIERNLHKLCKICYNKLHEPSESQ